MSQPNALELAKQGHPKAIESLINRQMQPKGITAKVALKNNCLHIMLEAAQPPDQKALVPVIRKGITNLGVASIEILKIYGKQADEQVPAWSQEFELVAQQTNSTISIDKQETLSSSVTQQPSLEKKKISKSQQLPIVETIKQPQDGIKIKEQKLAIAKISEIQTGYPFSALLFLAGFILIIGLFVVLNLYQIPFINYFSLICLALLIVAGIRYYLFTSQGKQDFQILLEKLKKEISYFWTKDKIFDELENFNPSHKFISSDNKTGIAVDTTSKRICLLINEKGIFPADIRRIIREVIPYKDILEVAIYEDGDTVTKTSRTSQVAGALIGNIMLGGAGMVIGALSGAKRTQAKTSNLELRLTINNTNLPFWSIVFLHQETNKKSSHYKYAVTEVNKWNSLIKVLIKQADEEC
jgi:hypothetical protein